MKAYVYLAIVGILSSMTLGSCSSNAPDNSPLEPGGTPSVSAKGTSHHTWGLWQFSADPVTETLDVVQLRTGNFHLNALPFLEPPPFVNLTLESVEFNGNIVEAVIGLRHPFLSLDEFTGFDVCGILITNGSITNFDDTDLRMAGEGDTRLLNPDGYSRWWNPAEFPNDGTIFGYTDGLLGAPDSYADYNSTLNAYKYFCDDLGADDPLSDVMLASRGMFSAGQKNIRHYTIELGDEGLIFNYAVDANWKAPQGGPPWTVPDDFPQGANRPEAWQVSVAEVENTLWNDGVDSGGGLFLSIDIYDWYDAVLNTVKVESPGNFEPVISATPTGGGAGYSTYEVEILDATPDEGSIDLLISVASEATGYGGLLPGKTITAYFTHTVTVSNEAPYTGGWALTWGGNDDDWGCGVAVSSTGDIYICGGFEGTADFDPGDGVEERTAIGTWGDFFLSKFDSQGDFQWVRTWASDTGFDDIDVWGDYVYVCGYFRGTVDFDPGSGVDEHSAGESLDTFVSKFDSSGDFIWARTWGGNNQNMAKSIAITPTGDVYTSGYFAGDSDFDPSSGEDWHSAHGTGVDAFLSKLDSDGDFLWARTWGSTNHGDDGWGLATDSQGDAYVAGDFSGTTDFDPGPGVEERTPNSDNDVFLTKFNSDGDFQWVRAWGGTGVDMGASVIVYQPDDYVYVSGQFENTVDFDPEGAGDIHESNGFRDAFVSKFTSSGDFLWARTWGGSDYECAWYINVSPSGEPCACGYYRSSGVDFDPGPGVDEHSTNGGFDIFLSKFDSSGDFLWAKTWGGSGGDNSWGVAVSLESEIYITGNFEGTVDFDPSDGIDERTSSGGDDAFLSKFLPDGSW